MNLKSGYDVDVTPFSYTHCAIPNFYSLTILNCTVWMSLYYVVVPYFQQQGMH